MKKKAVVLSSGVYMFIDWSLASLEWTLVLYLYMIPGPQLPGPEFFHRIPAISSCFQMLPEASICLTNPHFEINDLKSMIWNPCLLMITNAYQPRFEISDYWWFIIGDLELLITDDYWSHCPASGRSLGFL
jgi:hypothetical protein